MNEKFSKTSSFSFFLVQSLNESCILFRLYLGSVKILDEMWRLCSVSEDKLGGELVVVCCHCIGMENPVDHI